MYYEICLIVIENVPSHAFPVLMEIKIIAEIEYEIMSQCIWKKLWLIIIKA